MKRNILAIMFAISLLLVILTIQQTASALKPKSGEWTIYNSNYPNKGSAAKFVVGTVDNQGKLVGWQIGTSPITGSYIEATGKITFSLSAGAGGAVLTKSYTGYFMGPPTCFSGDVVNTCFYRMVGTTMTQAIGGKTVGWYAQYVEFVPV